MQIIIQNVDKQYLDNYLNFSSKVREEQEHALVEKPEMIKILQTKKTTQTDLK